MSRYERGIFFEALCALREGYACRSEADRTPVVSVEGIIAWVEGELVRKSSLDPVATDEPKA